MTIQIIGGKYKKRKLFAPKTDLTRPSKSILREALFNMCAFYIEDSIFLDLFAGSGSVGFEALSRGAQKVIFVENQKIAIQAIKKNAALLKVEDKIHILEKDVYSSLSHVPYLCDIVFADPPYNKDKDRPAFHKLFEFLEEHTLLSENGHFFLETHRKEPLYPHELKTLKLHKQKIMGNSQLLEYRSISTTAHEEENG